MTSPDGTPDLISRVLSVLDSISGCTFSALAIGSAIILYYPYSVGVDLTAFKKEYGGWLFVLMTIATCLALAKLSKSGYSVWAYRKATRSFNFTPILIRCWWVASKQKDDSFCTQIMADCDVLNLTDGDLQFHSVRLIKPKVSPLKFIEADVSVFRSNLSERDFIQPYTTGVVRIHFLIRGKIGKTGKVLKTAMVVTDCYGNKQKIKIPLRPIEKVP